jgi:hypothetical protein
MQLLLITSVTNWIFCGIAAFVLLFGIATAAWAISSAECMEHEEDPIYAPDEMDPYSNMHL